MAAKVFVLANTVSEMEMERKKILEMQLTFYLSQIILLIKMCHVIWHIFYFHIKKINGYFICVFSICCLFRYFKNLCSEFKLDINSRSVVLKNAMKEFNYNWHKIWTWIIIIKKYFLKDYLVTHKCWMLNETFNFMSLEPFLLQLIKKQILYSSASAGDCTIIFFDELMWPLYDHL